MAELSHTGLPRHCLNTPESSGRLHWKCLCALRRQHESTNSAGSRPYYASLAGCKQFPSHSCPASQHNRADCWRAVQAVHRHQDGVLAVSCSSTWALHMGKQPDTLLAHAACAESPSPVSQCQQCIAVAGGCAELRARRSAAAIACSGSGARHSKDCRAGACLPLACMPPEQAPDDKPMPRYACRHCRRARAFD